MSLVSIAVDPNADASPLDAVRDMEFAVVFSACGADGVPDAVSLFWRWCDLRCLHSLCIHARICRDLTRFQCLCPRTRIWRELIRFQSLGVQPRICRRRARMGRRERQETDAKENPHDGRGGPESDEMWQGSKIIPGTVGHPLNPRIHAM
jgi:hypothetical protein